MRALTACRGPEQKITRIQAEIVVSHSYILRARGLVPTLKTEVGEEGNVLGPLLTLCQLCKDEESSPSLALAHLDAFETNSQVVQVRLSDGASPHDALSSDVLITDIEEG